MDDELKPGLYRHYRGGLYTVIGLVTHHETRLPMVLYVSHTFCGMNVRPLHGWEAEDQSACGASHCDDRDGWLDPVDVVGGGSVPRFEYIGPLPSDTPIAERRSTLYAPQDVDYAHEAWGANCGPCALAALVGVPVDAVREYFPGFPDRPHTNPTIMREAIARAGVREREVLLRGPRDFPLHGLAFIQWEGPWTQPGVPARAAYRYTHWIAVHGDDVYDANFDGWCSRANWEATVVPVITRDIKRATGGWFVRMRFELVPVGG